jgi:glutamate 5-kinase
MYSKLLGAKRAAQLGVPTLIVSGKVPFVLEKVFSGECLGTWIMPEQRNISQRKFWLAYNLDPSGALYIDQGAKQALVMRGKSLLPAGVVKVEGNFEIGEMVKLIGPDQEQIGVGLVNFSSEEISRISGKKSPELADILKHEVLHVEAVHRDNLLLDAVH